jgi:alkylation response protein AidB-like acyl-CoA dehydrogenase
MPYRAPVDEYLFLFDHIVGLPEVAATERFAEATPDMTAAILHEAARLCEEVMAPLQRSGDLHPARLENGIVRTSPGFAEGYRAIATGGWVSIAASPEHGGMGLPMVLTTAVNEMMSAACLSLQLAPLMTQGQIEALEHHASDALKALYLPKLVSGDWAGTMNLTEPQAGSDVGALRSRAEPNGDGTYAITGQKVYITWGDNDFTENVCHLVLARLPDGVPGTKGISLFLVPKFIPDENGNPGTRNALNVVSLEHKMGLHGSPTCVMQYDGATGWLVGHEHDGMRAMFTMMNNARLGVGGQGVGVAEGATQHALAYARERRQGRTANDASGGAILGHADVRRMLATMRAETFAARAIALACAQAIDMQTATGAPRWRARAALLTPLAKVFGTETGIAVADIGVQVHGGMGFIEETGAAQYLRDVRVTAIYEGAIPYLRGFARVLGAHFHLKAALAEGGTGPRTRLARFYITRLLPEHIGHFAHGTSGAGDLYALDDADFGA